MGLQNDAKGDFERRLYRVNNPETMCRARCSSVDILIPNSATVRFSECSEEDDTDKEFHGFEVPPSQESEWNSKSKN